MADVTVTTEHEYVTVNTLEWFEATAENVTDYWVGIVERIKDSCPEHEHYDYSRESDRCARDRVIAALRARADATGYVTEAPFGGATINHDNNFETDFAYEVAPLFRGGYEIGYLVFVSLGDYYDSGLDYVFQVDGWEDSYHVLDARVEYYCDNPEHPEQYGDRREIGSTRNGGYDFEFGESCDTRRDVIVDGVATCSMGHTVELFAEVNY